MTSSVTTYHIPSNWIKHGRFNHNKDPYCINIIDTPGFGDTRGLEMEKCINEMIKNSLQSIDTIDSIFLVVKSNE
jgi:hypothetical protein